MHTYCVTIHNKYYGTGCERLPDVRAESLEQAKFIAERLYQPTGAEYLHVTEARGFHFSGTYGSFICIK